MHCVQCVRNESKMDTNTLRIFGKIKIQNSMHCLSLKVDKEKRRT